MIRVEMQDGKPSSVDFDNVAEFRAAFGDGLLTPPEKPKRKPKKRRRVAVGAMKSAKKKTGKRNNGFTPEVYDLAKKKGITAFAARREVAAAKRK